MTMRKKYVVLRDLLLEKRTKKKKKNDNSNNFGWLCETFFVFPLSVRIFALLHNAILWGIRLFPCPNMA